MADVKVSLSGGTISVDKNKVDVSVSKADKVKWVSQDGQFGIKMPAGYPTPVIEEKNGKWEGTAGPFTASGTTLKYDVTSPGKPDLDPEIEIIP